MTAEGVGQLVIGNAEDKSGNSATTTATINLDKFDPTINATKTPLANINGWNNSDVTISFGCADSGSGIATCPASTLLNTEGAGQVISGTTTDLSGKSESLTTTVNIDKTAPTIQIGFPEEGVVLTESSLIVSGTISETNPIASFTINSQPVIPAMDGSFTHEFVLLEGDNTITVSAMDIADNSGSTTVNVTFNPNKPPSINSAPLTGQPKTLSITMTSMPATLMPETG